MCRYFHLLAAFGCCINIRTKEVLFASGLSSSACSHVCSPFYQWRAEKGWLCLFWHFAVHSGLVHNVTDTDCWAHKDSTYVMFSRLLNVDFQQTRPEIGWKAIVCPCSKNSTPFDRESMWCFITLGPLQCRIILDICYVQASPLPSILGSRTPSVSPMGQV